MPSAAWLRWFGSLSAVQVLIQMASMATGLLLVQWMPRQELA